MSDVDEEAYNNLFQAQKGFYSKIGSVVKLTTVLSLLPYAIAVIKPHAMAVVQAVAPSLVAEGA